MIKSVVGIDNPVSVRGITIIPIVKLSLHYSLKAGISIFSTRQPVAVVMISPLQNKSFRITGEEVPLEQLMQEFPEVRETLEKFQPDLRQSKLPS